MTDNKETKQAPAVEAGALTITEEPRDGNWYEFNVNGHHGVIRVVARMDGEDDDLPLGNQIRAFLLSGSALIDERDAAVMRTHMQAFCIQQCAAHIGPDTATTLYGLPKAVKRIVQERDEARAALARASEAVAGEPVAYTTPLRLKQIAEGNRPVDTMWHASMRDEGDIPLYAAPQPAQAEVPAGYKLVPTEPTPLMSAAGFSVSQAEHDPAQVYRAMIAAAPQPASEQQVHADVPECNGSHDQGTIDAGIEKECTACTGEASSGDKAVYQAIADNYAKDLKAEQQAARWLEDRIRTALPSIRAKTGNLLFDAGTHDACEKIEALLAAKGDGHE